MLSLINCSQFALMKDKAFPSTAAQFHLTPTMCLTASLGETEGAPVKIKKKIKITIPVGIQFQGMLLCTFRDFPSLRNTLETYSKTAKQPLLNSHLPGTQISEG